jgi:4-hydroxythreonine-4-phosphate dehydrogenase
MRGIKVEGPFPADSFWSRVWPSARFNTVLAMYHDQGLIPVKNGILGPSVNITLGLPFPRVSVDHGTAYDIAGQGKADPAGLVTAIEYAIKLSGKPGRLRRIR